MVILSGGQSIICMQLDFSRLTAMKRAESMESRELTCYLLGAIQRRNARNHFVISDVHILWVAILPFRRFVAVDVIYVPRGESSAMR